MADVHQHIELEVLMLVGLALYLHTLACCCSTPCLLLAAKDLGLAANAG